MSINRQPSAKDLRWFAGLLIPFASFISWQLWRRDFSEVACYVVAGVGFGIGVLGLINPAAVRRLYVGWMIAVSPIATVVTFTLMALVYFGVLWPVSWLTHAKQRDALKLQIDRKAQTYWEQKPQVTDPRRYFRQF